MHWINGRKMEDEFERVKAAYVMPRYIDDEHTNEELMEAQVQRERLSINQAR